MLNKQQIIETFMNTQLKENYNFLEEDLETLAQAFINKSKPEVQKSERELCIEIVSELNKTIADKLKEVLDNKFHV